MKQLKLFLFFLVGATVISCSSDDDKGSEQSPIIGTWKPVSSITTLWGVETNSLGECEINNRIQFRTNGNISGEDCNKVEGSYNDCLCEDIPVGYVSWELEDNQLTYCYSFIGCDTGTVSFSNNNNTMVTVFEEGPADQRYTYTTTYERVN